MPLWGSDTFQTVLVGIGDRAGGLQLSCLPRGCSVDPAGASLADGVCLTLALDAASKVTEQEWREKAKKDLEEWNLRQNEQMEKNRANNRYVGLNVATRAAMGAAVKPDLPSWDVCGPLSPQWGPALREQSFPRHRERPRALSGSSGCAEPPWLGPHWDLSASCPLCGPCIGAGLGHCLCSPAVTGRFSWCHVCCDEWVTLCGRTLTPSLFLSF